MASEIIVMINNGHMYVIDHGDEYTMKKSIVPASEETIKGIRRVKVKEDGLECSICLEEYEVGEEVKEMKCCHKFHSECVDKWLRVNGSCPVCRFTLPEQKKDKKETKENDREMRIRFVNGQMVIDHGVSL